MIAQRSKKIKWRTEPDGSAFANCMGWRVTVTDEDWQGWTWRARWHSADGDINACGFTNMKKCKRAAEDFISEVEAGVLADNS